MRRSGYGLALLLALSATASRAQDLAGARTFVSGLYGAYHGHGPDYLGRQAKAVFSPALLALIRYDRTHTPKGDIPTLDGDPICDCQDFAGLQVTDLKVATAAKDRATATVRLRFTGGETSRLTLDLIPIEGGWRVDDVHSAGTPSLAGLLREHGGGR